MKVIDFHNHYYPPGYIEAIRRGPSRIRVTEDARGNPVLHSPGDKNIAVPGHRDIAYRKQVIQEPSNIGEPPGNIQRIPQQVYIRQPRAIPGEREHRTVELPRRLWCLAM